MTQQQTDRLDRLVDDYLGEPTVIAAEARLSEGLPGRLLRL